MYDDYDPCENCEIGDAWECKFCCEKCIADGLEHCEDCDSWDI